MLSKLSRFTDQVVSLAQKAGLGETDPAFEEGEGGNADWVIVAILASTSTWITRTSGCWTSSTRCTESELNST